MSSHQLFVLDGFSELGPLRPLLFIPFFIVFVVSLLANSLLIFVIASKPCLHTPMCVLIACLACLELSVPLFFVPNMLLSFLFDWRGISLIGCLLQIYFIHLMGTFQSTILLWMALDRYFAICSPLLYQEQMAMPRFLRFVVPLVVRNVLIMTVLVVLAGRLQFCSGNVINHCFCEHMALVELACGSTTLNSVVGLLTMSLVLITDFILILISYGIIFRTVLLSSSGTKALHTCFTHLLVMCVSLVVILVAFLSYRVRTGLGASSRVFFSVMYLLFPSCFNPIVYGIRTSQIRQQVLKTLSCCR